MQKFALALSAIFGGFSAASRRYGGRRLSDSAKVFNEIHGYPGIRASRGFTREGQLCSHRSGHEGGRLHRRSKIRKGLAVCRKGRPAGEWGAPEAIE